MNWSRIPFVGDGLCLLKKFLFLAAVSILMLVGGAGPSLGADMKVQTRSAPVKRAVTVPVPPKTVTLEAGGKPIQVPVTGRNLHLVRSADVVKRVGNQDVPVPSAEVSVKPLSPTAQCALPGCRMIRLTAGKGASGEYQVRLKDAGKRVIASALVQVRSVPPEKAAVIDRQGASSLSMRERTAISQQGKVLAPRQQAFMKKPATSANVAPQTNTAIQQGEAPTPVLPDLTGEYDVSKSKVIIRNIGTADAIFVNGGSLGGTEMVPPGGRIVVGQSVEVSPNFSNVVCPETPTAAQWHFLPMRIDPGNLIVESNENNNEVTIYKDFPARLTPAQAAAWETDPGDVQVFLATREMKSGDYYSIEVDLTWKNVGQNYIYSCSNGSLNISLKIPNYQFSGGVGLAGISKNTERLAPGEELKITRSFVYKRDTQYGPTYLLAPGCYPIEAEYDTHNVVRESNKTNNRLIQNIPLNGGVCP